MNRLERNEQILVVVFCALLTVPLLYIARSLDDNTLTSWRWVFGAAGFGRVMLALVVVIPLAVMGGRVEALERPLVPVVLAAAAIVPAFAVPEMLLDAGRYVIQAKYVALEGPGSFWKHWGGRVPAWTDLPLVPFLYGLIFRVFGENRVWIQIFNTGVFAATVFLTYLLGTSLWDRRTGFVAALLLLGIPYLMTQVPMMLVDLHSMFLLVLSVYAFTRALQAPRPVVVMTAAASLTLLLLSKYSAWGFACVLPVLAWALGDGNLRKWFPRAFIPLAMGAAGCGLFLFTHGDTISAQMKILASYNLPALSRWHESYPSTLLFQMHPAMPILAFYAAFDALRSKDRRFLVVAFAVLLPLLLDLQRIRYLLPLFPFIALAGGYGLRRAIPDDVVRRVAVFCVVGTSLVLFHGAYAPFLRTTSMGNLREAGLYLDSQGITDTDVYFRPQDKSTGNTAAAIAVLDLYTRAHIHSPQLWREGGLPENLKAVPLRFTWELERPEFYESSRPGEANASVGIFPGSPDGGGTGLSAKNPDCRVFSRQDSVFRFQTSVAVCENSPWPERGTTLSSLADLGQLP